MGFVRNIVGRFHVGVDYLEICRAVTDSLRGGRRAFLLLPREIRRDIIREAIYTHKENRAIYHAVTAGRF